MTATMKRCPECAEEVLADARRCKHCGHDFRGRATAAGWLLAIVCFLVAAGLVLVLISRVA